MKSSSIPPPARHVASTMLQPVEMLDQRRGHCGEVRQMQVEAMKLR